jgi:hypothetical protein
VVAQLGFCGLDGRRQPLRGDEVRGCWEAALIPAGAAAATPSDEAPPGLEFVRMDRPAVEPLPLTAPVEVTVITGGRYSLFDLDP